MNKRSIPLSKRPGDIAILGEEIGGIHATPHLPVVLLANLPWLLFPIYIIYRM